MKRIFKSQFWAMLLVAAMTVGCTESPIDEVGGVDTPSAEPIEVSMNLSVEPMSAGTKEAEESGTLTESRSIDGMTISEEIKNLWVIQFNGTEDTNIVVGTPIYIADFDSDTSITTLIPADTPNIVVYLANTFSEGIGVVAGTTMEAFKKMTFTTSSEDGCFASDGVDTTTKYMLMNGYTKFDTIDETTIISGKLKRSISKVNITIENNVPDDLVITSAQMCNIIKNIPYFTEQINTDGDELSLPFPSSSSIFDYDIESLNGSSNVTLSFYIPCNMQGVIDYSTETTKPLVAPTYASYVEIVGTVYGNDEYTYTFFLGGNMTDDFNIRPNYQYTYTFTFDGVGDPDLDNRVESLGDIDYRQRESSNCYILNPSGTRERSYIIPIEDRINTFWRDYADAPRTVTSSNWEVEVLWHDCDNNPIAADGDELTSQTLEIEPVVGDLIMPTSMKVTLGPGFNNYGNVVVAVREKGGDIFWSWHFWITDYNPDSRDHVAIDGTYQYSVDNGEIHRYIGSIWESDGYYADAFIMDRDLGSRGTSDYTGSYIAGCLYYQYGRKDPFPGKYGKYPDDSGGYSLSSPILTGTTNGETFSKSVTNPTTMYFYTNGGAGANGYNWCSEVTSLSTLYMWNDKNVLNSSASETYHDKSIFDPSPLGWKLPLSGTYSDYDTTTFPNYAGYVGRSYTTASAYYNYSGSRNAKDGEPQSISLTYRWYLDPSSDSKSRTFYSYSASVFQSHGMERATGCCVRCVKDVD